ncbi:MAG: DNA polymerase [Planctomycetes bacterium]|nr:DNA polymerase [Planctomycetota bacterium]
MLSSLFLDMNAYFASCEQQLRPYLRNCPIAVVPMIANTTCCIAASYEAKKFGIKTGTGVREAKQLCPELKIVKARPEKYVEIHNQIIEAVELCMPVTTVCSIDELYCKLMGIERHPDNAIKLAKQIKKTIYDRVGPYLKCSVGIGPNKFLSKVATNMQKPDGLVVIQEHELPEKLYSLDLSDIPGIGRSMLRRLNKRDITTMQQLCALSQDDFKQIWESVVGIDMWKVLQGQDVTEPPLRRKSVGHSHVLPPRLRTDDAAFAVIAKLIHKAAVRLRRLDYWAGQMYVRVIYDNGQRWKVRASLGLCKDTVSMLEAFSLLWENRPTNTSKPFQVGIVLTNLLHEKSVSIPLYEGQKKRLQIAYVVDRINEKLGLNSIYYGCIQHSLKEAPTRIAFTHIPEIFD